MPRPDLIDMKLNRLLRPMVDDLKRNRRVLARVGGHVVETLGEEVAFQEARIQNLEWAETATDEEIQQRIQQLESELTPDERLCTCGSVRGLSLETIRTIAMIEDLEIALGIHPAVSE